MSLFPDCFKVIRGAPWIVAGPPSCRQACPRHSSTSLQCSQTYRLRCQACSRCSQVLPGAPKVLSGTPRYSQTYHNHSHGTPVPVIRDSSYSEGRPECPPRVWYSSNIDASKFTLHIYSDTAWGFQWLKYILLMSQAAKCPSYSPINRWPCSMPQAFKCRPTQNSVSGAPGLGHLLHPEGMGLGCCYTRSIGGGWIRSQNDFHLSCSSNDLKIGDWERFNGVGIVHSMGEFHSRVGDFGTQRHSRHCQWRTGVQSIPETQFFALSPVGDRDNSTPLATGTCISLSTNSGGNYAQSGRDLQDFHRQDETFIRFQTPEPVACGKHKSYPHWSDHQYWWPGHRKEYPPDVIWNLYIQSETINQQLTFLLSTEFWDFW